MSDHEKKGPSEEAGVTPREALAIASDVLKKARFDQAAAIYRRILEVVPDEPDAHHFLGVAVYHLGQTKEAIAHIERAIAIDPSYADAHNNLGNVLRQQGRLDEAEASYQRASAIRPDNADTVNNFGTILRARGRLEESLAHYRRAIELVPEHPEAHHNLGNVLLALDRDDEALDAFQLAMSLRPYHPGSYRNLGTALYSLGRVDDAAEIYRKWLAIEPDHPEPTHMLAACTGENVAARASNGFIRHVFDRFAYSFDEVLHRLEYKAPELVAETIARVVGPANGALDVLDAGCGTGLSAPLLRPHATRLVGVDLSERMLGFARDRGGHDELVMVELTEYLEGHPASFDLVASVDTLVYFGDLSGACRGLARSLRSGGHAVFTLEKAEPSEAPAGFRLNPHGRYSHTEEYVRRALADAGLDVASVREAALRLERKEPVMGLVVAATKP
jgi:predicted TPR repeat methyltransferase